jgi:hypothetical protein
VHELQSKSERNKKENSPASSFRCASGSFHLERGANIFKGAYTFKNKQMSDLIDNLWILMNV